MPYHATQRCNVRHHTILYRTVPCLYCTVPRRTIPQNTMLCHITAYRKRHGDGRGRAGGGCVPLAYLRTPVASPGYQPSGHLAPRGRKLADQRCLSRGRLVDFQAGIDKNELTYVPQNSKLLEKKATTKKKSRAERKKKQAYRHYINMNSIPALIFICCSLTGGGDEEFTAPPPPEKG